MKWLLFVLFIGYYSSITLFLHTHHLSYGVITHSHPFSDSNHEHSAGAYQIIDEISDFVSDGAVVGAALVALFFLLAELTFEKPTWIREQRLAQTLFLRGPPSL